MAVYLIIAQIGKKLIVYIREAFSVIQYHLFNIIHKGEEAYADKTHRAGPLARKKRI